ncbi:MAG: trypsin-like peptidase domain-containing protein [Verrucomicrobiia bacterium]
MGLHSLFTGSKTTRLMVAALFGSCLNFHAAEPPTVAATTNAAATSGAGSGTIENSVVKIFATVRYPNPYQPWTKDSPEDQTGSGVVIEGKRILTNAHVVNYASQVQIQANQAGDKISATVEAIAPGIDLAVLKLDDEKFFDTHPMLARARTLPGIKDTVLTYGYPEGGNSLSITKGIVSRVEFAPYNYPVCGLRIQIDAAINPGNSGGPAIVGDKMIGLTFSRLNEAENIGYIIPSEEIGLFLQDIADGHYDGKPAMYDTLQTLENPALRSFLKLPPNVEGMVVHKPYKDDPAYPLKEWDVIARIGDTPVDDQGMIKLGDNLRVRFEYEIQHITTNGTVPLTIVRAGKELKVNLPISANYPQLIPGLNGAYPSYFIYGPLVFSAATEEYLGGLLGTKYAGSVMSHLSYQGNPLVTRRTDQPAFPGEGLVIIASPFFPHKLAQGYDNPRSQVVKAVNGIPVKNLNHLVEILRDAKDEFITIECNTRYGETMIFPRAQMLAATDEILTDNGVRSQGSADTLAIWNAKPSR